MSKTPTTVYSEELAAAMGTIKRQTQELTAAKEQIAELQRRCDEREAERDNFLRSLETAEAQIKALREESERLDWFIDNCDDPPWETFGHISSDEYRMKSRAYIDAARKK